MSSYILDLILRKDKFDAAAQDVLVKMNNGFSNLGKRLAGYLSFAGIAMYIRNQINLASSINDSAAKARIGTERFQELKYAAEQNGSSAEDVSSALRTLARTQTEAANKAGEFRETFERIGVSLSDLKHMRVDDLFLSIAKKIGEGNGSTQAFIDTLKVLGRNAESLFPAFRDGFTAAMDEAQGLGVVIKDDIIQTLDDLNDSFSRTIAQLNTALIPALTEMLQILADSLWYWKTFAGAIGAFSAYAPSLSDIGKYVGSANSRGAYQPEDTSGGFKTATEKAYNAMLDYLTKEYEDKVRQDATTSAQRKRKRDAVESMSAGEFAPESNKTNWKRPSADTLAKIGLFVGTLPSQRIAQLQLNQMKEMHWTIRDIKQTIDKKL